MAGSEAAGGTLRADIIAAIPRLRRFCQSMAGNSVDGDELVQATIERALARSHQFVPGTRVDSWMFRIAQNLHIDAQRRTKRRGVHVSVDELVTMPGDDGRTIVEHRSELAAAQKALMQIPADQRAAFLLVVVEGMTYNEAADLLDVPVGTVMSRLSRARRRLADLLPQKGPLS